MDAAVVGALVQVLPDESLSPRSQRSSHATLAAGSWRTELNVSGKGWLHALLGMNEQGAGYVQFRVTIDGGTPQLIGAGLAIEAGHVCVDRSSFSVGYVVGARFKSSLLIEVKNASASSTFVSSHVVYSI